MTNEARPKKTRWWVPLIKITFVMGFLYLLARKGMISLQATQRAFGHWELIAPAFGALLLATVLGMIRWQFLLRAHDIHLKWMRTAQLTMVGLFFNIALPGAVSGDFIKAFYIGLETPGNRARAFGSILFDRVVGLSALVLLSAGALIFGLDSFKGTRLLAGIQIFVGISALAVAVFYGYLFFVREHHDPFFKATRALERKYPKTGSIARIYEGLKHYHNHRLVVIQALLLSVGIHLTVGWVCWSFARALGDEGLRLLAIYVTVPLGLLVTAVPIAPAGLGTGHVAFASFFSLIGSQRGADVYSLYALAQIFIGGLGGLVYLQFKAHGEAVDLKAMQSVESLPPA